MPTYNSEITIGYKDKKESNWFCTYKSPSELESFWQNQKEENENGNSIWEYLDNKEVFFGRYNRELFEDNSILVNGERSGENSYYIYFGKPPFYSVYVTKNPTRFLAWGIRLRKFVDKIGKERLLELFRKRYGIN